MAATGHSQPYEAEVRFSTKLPLSVDCPKTGEESQMTPMPPMPATNASDAPPRTKPSNYPEPYASMMAGRVKRPLGDLFNLKSFGINHVTLPPGAVSALHHRHTRQDEFVYVIAGRLSLVYDAGETVLTAGMCVGFPRGGTAHHLVNRSSQEASYLEVGDRQPGDAVEYPRDDIQAVMGADAKWRFAHKNGTPY
jgi:uncharacterized cupin superfamily protein